MSTEVELFHIFSFRWHSPILILRQIPPPSISITQSTISLADKLGVKTFS